MRQLKDTLVWLGLVLVFAGAIYVTPRVANYVAAQREQSARADATRDFALNYIPTSARQSP